MAAQGFAAYLEFTRRRGAFMTHTQRVRSTRRSLLGSAAASMALVLVLVGAASAQGSADKEGEAVFRGVVLDAATRNFVEGARVLLEGSRGGTLTDSLGAFEVVTKLGSQRLTVEQYGYEAVVISVIVDGAPREPFEVALQPKPVMLDGVTVVAERLETMQRRLRSRRRAAAVSVRDFDLDRLMTSHSWDMEDFLRFEASVHIVSCARGSISSRCVLRRGSRSAPKIYVDEAPIVGGLDQLASYTPQEFFLVEVYAGGLVIRAYSHWFMERMARSPIALLPWEW